MGSRGDRLRSALVSCIRIRSGTLEQTE
jgi:hypothetical protein